MLDGLLKHTFLLKLKNQIQCQVVPHWQGEVGLCTDFPQLAMESFRQTNQIDIGSAVVSILASGGPIAQAERIANTVQFLSMMDESRKLYVGFSAGRFEFMARPYGITPRNSWESAAWKALRGQIFLEASEIFLRLLKGEIISSDKMRKTILTRSNFRSDEDWLAVQEAYLAHNEEEMLIQLPFQIAMNSKRYQLSHNNGSVTSCNLSQVPTIQSARICQHYSPCKGV